MRLKPAGILTVLAIIAVLAYFAIKPRLSKTDNQTTTEIGTNPGARDKDSAVNPNSTPTTKNTKKEERAFNYSPEKPVDGTLRGVVELGASGFNSFIINMDSQKRWEIVSKDFGESLAYEGLATTDDIRTGLKKYISGMFNKGIANKNMHFVISSGAQKEPKTKLISNELKKMGYVVNNVTPDQEAKFGFKSTIPPSFSDNSFMVDIGSGNTKISWEEDGRLKAMELPGAKYYEKGLNDEQVYDEVKKQAATIPESKRNVGFILGGVPYTLAKQHRKGEERYTVLNEPQSYKQADKKIASGLNIYRAIADATRTDTFVFDWDANFTIGFLIGLNK